MMNRARWIMAECLIGLALTSSAAIFVACRGEGPLGVEDFLAATRNAVVLLQLQTYDANGKARGPLVLDLESFAHTGSVATGQSIKAEDVARAIEGPFQEGRFAAVVRCKADYSDCEVDAGAAVSLDTLVKISRVRAAMFFTVAKRPYDFVRNRSYYCGQTIRALLVRQARRWSLEGLSNETEC